MNKGKTRILIAYLFVTLAVFQGFTQNSLSSVVLNDISVSTWMYQIQGLE